MSFVMNFYVYCDYRTKDNQNHPECHHAADPPGLSREEALDVAREDGWLILSRKHYCPSCRKLTRGRRG